MRENCCCYCSVMPM
uniref:Uncharacterized protein n=1 Tax=Anguilla anguilla TaxID=7936 RepID=A0A0E9R758_ANGAN